MNWALILLFYLLALFCEIIGTIGGFGSSVFFVPISSLFFDFKTVLGLTALMHVFSNLSKIILFFKHTDWKVFLLFGIPSIVFVLIGSLLTRYIDYEHLDLILGIFLVVISLIFLVFPKVKLKPTKLNSIIGGGLSGFTAGIIGTGGAIRGLFLTSYNLEKSIFIATSAMIDMGIDLSRSVVYVSQGYVKNTTWWYIPGLIGIAFLGSWIGKLILKKINQETFRKIVLFLILGIGIFTLIKHFIDIM